MHSPQYMIDFWSDQGLCDQVACVLLNDPVPFRVNWPKNADLRVNNVRLNTGRRNVLHALGPNGRDEAVAIGSAVLSGTVGCISLWSPMHGSGGFLLVCQAASSCRNWKHTQLSHPWYVPARCVKVMPCAKIAQQSLSAWLCSNESSGVTVHPASLHLRWWFPKVWHRLA